MGAAAKLLDQVPLIDAAKLQSIKDLGEPGDADGFFRDLLKLFFERAPILLKDIDLALAERDELRLERAAHAMKGTAGNLGAMQMMMLSEQLEKMGRDAQLAGAEAWARELHLVYAETRTELEHRWLS
jgi:two-component system sensor histidine kinase/response regulator